MKKHLITVGLVAAGVIVGGYALYQGRKISFIAQARNGFQGVS